MGVSEKVVETLLPSYLKSKLAQYDQRLELIEQWRTINISQWATGVDGALDTLVANQKTLQDAQVATADDLKKARGDAVDLALGRLSIPKDLSVSDVGAFLTKVRDISKKVPAGVSFQMFSTASTIPTMAREGGVAATPAVIAPAVATPSAFKMGGPLGLGAMPAARRALQDSLGPDIPGISDFMGRIEGIVVTDYEKLQTILKQWNTFYEATNTWIANRTQITDLVTWMYQRKYDVEEFVASGRIPAAASSKIQSWITTAVDAVKGMASAAQLSTDKLAAIQALLTKVSGTNVKLIDALSGVVIWYNDKTNQIKGEIDNYISAYQSGTLPQFINDKISAYTRGADFKDLILSKLNVYDLKDKLKEYLMNIPGMKTFIDQISNVWEDITTFVDKLIAGFKEAKRILTSELPKNLVDWKATFAANIKAYKDRLSSDLKRDIWTVADAKQYSKDAVNDVKQLAEYAGEALRSLVEDYIAYFLKMAFTAMVDPVKDLAISAFDKVTAKTLVTAPPA